VPSTISQELQLNEDHAAVTAQEKSWYGNFFEIKSELLSRTW
jgi:hypothetical protein